MKCVENFTLSYIYIKISYIHEIHIHLVSHHGIKSLKLYDLVYQPNIDLISDFQLKYLKFIIDINPDELYILNFFM